MAKATKHQHDEAALIELFARKDYQGVEAQACALCRKYPRHGFYWKALGTARNLLGDLPSSVEALQTAARLLPGDAELLSNLGCTFRKLKRTDEAETAFLKALILNPNSAPALNNLGFLYKDQERYQEAETALLRALELRPGYGEALNNLGMVLSCMGRYAEAQTHLRQALESSPDYPEAWNNLGIALDGKPAEAETAFRKALEYRPLFPQACIGLANALKEQARVEEGLAVLNASLDTSPKHQESYVTLGGLLMELGDITASEQALRTALRLDPGDVDAHSLRLFCMTYSDTFSNAQRLAAAHDFGKALSNKATPYVRWQRPASPRLRIGMVSGDFRKHPVGYFLENVLPHLASNAVELFAYSSNRKTDELTDRLRPFFSKWALIQGMANKDAARLIHEDGLDVLLDLSGHTAFHRLGVFAYKPAPIQASWLGYWATTGVEQMDVFIADAAGVPNPQHQPFTETLRTLPTRLCFSPPENAPDVAPLPALDKGLVTFGCFQNISKISDATLRLWQDVFSALPTARLRLQAKQLRDETARKRILSRLAAHGITAERVELVGPTERAAYLAAHAEVDIILDTVPYNGGTTTCEALWMGVPTLTLAGKSLIDRQGASLLTAAGLEDWITTSAADYVSKAVFWANRPEALAQVRQSLREHVADSKLFDGRAFAASLTALLTELAGKTLQDTSTVPLVETQNQLSGECMLQKRYLELLKSSLLNELYLENEVRLLYLGYMVASGKKVNWDAITYPHLYIKQIVDFVREKKRLGEVFYYINEPSEDGREQKTFNLRNVCDMAYTMIGRPRMDNIEQCLDTIRVENIPGDLIETGVCRGGAVIFMRGYLEAYDMKDRLVYCADSFEGLPKPTHAVDQGYDFSKEKYPVLAISLEQVQETFRRYGLLDEQVCFLKGWFCDTLPKAPVERLALLRLDGDLYESTMDALNNLYAKVSPGGFVIVDDYGTFEPCRKAVDEYRAAHRVTSPLVAIDPSSVYWRVEATKGNA